MSSHIERSWRARGLFALALFALVALSLSLGACGAPASATYAPATSAASSAGFQQDQYAAPPTAAPARQAVPSAAATAPATPPPARAAGGGGSSRGCRVGHCGGRGGSPTAGDETKAQDGQRK